MAHDALARVRVRVRVCVRVTYLACHEWDD